MEMDLVLSGMQLITTKENLSHEGLGSSLHLVACAPLFPWPVCNFQAEKGEEWKPMASVKWSYRNDLNLVLSHKTAAWYMHRNRLLPTLM